MRAVDEVADQTRYDGDGVVKCDRALESMLTPEPTACRIDHMTRFWWATAFKYVWRFPHKGGAKDVRKAIDCLQRVLARIEMTEKAEGSDRTLPSDVIE